MNNNTYNKIFNILKDGENKDFKEFSMLKESEFNKLVKESEGIIKIQDEIFSPKFSSTISLMNIVCSSEDDTDRMCEIVSKIMFILNKEPQGIIIISLAYILCERLYGSNIMDRIREMKDKGEIK